MTKNYRPSYCLYDATADEKYIKKAISDGSLAIFDTEKEALKAKQIGNGVTEVYLLSKKDIENIEINRVAFEQQQAQIDQILAIVHGTEDIFTTYGVEYDHSDPRGSMKRLGKVIEKMALDPAISHRANKLMINGAESYSRELMAATTSLIHPHFKGVLEAWKIKIERGEA
jgi:hypothetical protein